MNLPIQLDIRPMLLLLLEALAALLILLLIVWWTMFSGRKRGEWKAEGQESRENRPAKSESDEGRQ